MRADLLSKRQNHEEDFFQFLCASQKVQTCKMQGDPEHFFFKQPCDNRLDKSKGMKLIGAC